MMPDAKLASEPCRASRLFSRGLLALLCLLVFHKSAVSVSAQTNSQQIYLQCLTNFETYRRIHLACRDVFGRAARRRLLGRRQHHRQRRHSRQRGRARWPTRSWSWRSRTARAIPPASPCPPGAELQRQHPHLRQLCRRGRPQWGWNAATLVDLPCSSGSSRIGRRRCGRRRRRSPAFSAIQFARRHRQAVQTMTISEANHRAAVPPCSGWVGDTKAEEMAGTATCVVLRRRVDDQQCHASNWLASAESYFANTYTIDSTAGDPLASWVTTITAYPDWAIENHGFFHPEYAMVAGEEMGDSWLIARWMNPSVSAQTQPFAEHNVLDEWTSLQRCVNLRLGRVGIPGRRRLGLAQLRRRFVHGLAGRAFQRSHRTVRRQQ